MELVSSNGPVTHVGGGAKSKFSIAMNGKAFRVLSDTMYQDKPGSIVREISCNALDGQTAKGNPERPFQIHLPDSFEPWFAVRDYGIGLTPEQVENVFCVYFASSKDQSNDAIGAFGLGAKTPFSYTDQFNVTSIVNGTMYAYSAVIGDDGTPNIILMAEMPTDEESGVEVKIGIQEKDFKRFIDATRTQLRFFPVKPEVINFHGEFTFQAENEALFESENIRIFRNSGYGAKVHIVQGPVGYPLDNQQLREHLSQDERSFLDTMFNIGANLFFKIGEIGVTASREGVEYNAHTIASLKAKIIKARDEVTAWVETQITTLSNAYEKASFVNDNAVFRGIINGVTLDLAPAEKTTGGTYSFSLGDIPEFVKDVTFTNMAGIPVVKQQNVVTITEYSRGGMSGVTASRNTSNVSHIHPTKHNNFAIVIRDSGKMPVAKIRHYFKENGLEKLYCLSTTAENFEFTPNVIKAIADSLGGFDKITLVSTLPEPPKTAYDRTRSNYSRPTAYYTGNGANTDLDSVANWARVYDSLDELDDGGVYVTVERQRTENISYETRRVYADLCRAGEFKKKLYAIRENDVDKLAESGAEWIKLEKYVEERKAEVLANPNIKRHSIAELINEMCTSALGSRLDSMVSHGKLNHRTKMARIFKMRNAAQKVVSNSNINPNVLRIAGVDSSGHNAVLAMQNLINNMFDGIPLARQYRNGYSALSDSDEIHLVEYINHFAPK